MKKKILIPLIILGIIIVGIISMFTFNLCPPQGPWPMPPWCVAIVPYEYQELDYITETFEPTDKQLDFGVGTYDIWGNPHLFMDLGDDTRNNYIQTINRVGDINSDIYLITDVVTLTSDGDILYSEEESEHGMLSISTDYMVKIGNLVRENDIPNFIHFINLADFGDDIDDYLSRDLNSAEQLVGKEFKKKIEDENAYNQVDLNSYSEDQWDDMFGKWKEIMIIMSKKAEKSGVTHLIINPGDVGFNWRLNFSYQEEKYKEISEEVRKHFSGKIGVYGRVDELVNMNWNFIDFQMPTFNADSDWMLSKDLENANTEEVESIKKSLKNYFNREEWSKIKKESYLSITIPSVTNGIKIGWMSQSESNKHNPNFKAQAIAYEALFQTLYELDHKIDGVICYGYWWNDRLYPETKVLRNDNDYTIRSKDAEQVYYKWSKIFK